MVPVRRYIVFSDTQFHPWQETERAERWKEMTAVIDDIFVMAENCDCAGILFLGDMFESKRSIRSDVLALVYEHIANAIKKYNFGKFHFIAGNHDRYAGSYTQTALKIGGNFIVHDGNSPTYIDKELGIVALPYGATVKPTLKYRVLCSHVDIRNARMGTGIKADTSAVDERLFLKGRGRKMVLNGHYHVPQKVHLGKEYVKIHCVGAPFQHNWNDARYSHVNRGAMVLTVGPDSVAIDRVPFYRFPRFFSDDTDKNIRKGIDFVQVKVEVPEQENNKENTKVSGKDPTEFIRAYVCDRIKDVVDRKRFVKKGFELMKGDER